MSLLDEIVGQWKQEHPEENEESNRMMEIFNRIIGKETDTALYSAMYALFMVGASKYRDLMVAAGVDVVEIELNLLYNMQE